MPGEDQLPTAFGGIGGCAAGAEGGPWGPLCEGPGTVCWNRLRALAWVWVPPSDSWMTGLMAVSGRTRPLPGAHLAPAPP